MSEKPDMNVQTFAEQIAVVQMESHRRLELLRRCEWCLWRGIEGDSLKCPYCGNYKQQGHMAGCELARELVDVS